MRFRPLPPALSALALLALMLPAVAGDDGTGSELVERAETLLHSNRAEAARLLAAAVPDVQGEENAAVRAKLYLLDALRLELDGLYDEARGRVADALLVADRERLYGLRADSLVLAARLERRRGERRAALEALDQLRTVPLQFRDVNALAELAKLALEQGRFDTCIEHGVTARVLFDRDGEALRAAELDVLLADAFLQLGDTKSSARILTGVEQTLTHEVSQFEARPEFEAKLHVLRAKRARLDQDFNLAREQLARAKLLSSSPNEHLICEHAELALAERRYEDVVELFASTTGLAPKSTAQRRRLEGCALLAMERLTLALETRGEVERGLDVQPWPDERQAALRFLADLAEAEGDSARAIVHLEQLDEERARHDLGALVRLDERVRGRSFATAERAQAEVEFDSQRTAARRNLASRTRWALGGAGLLGLGALALAGITWRSRRRSASLANEAAASRSRQTDAEATLAFISHDLRNPLTTIRAAAEVLAKDLPSDHGQVVELIASGSRRMEGILESMLALMQYRSDTKSKNVTFELDKLLDDVVSEARPLANRKRVQIYVEQGRAVSLHSSPVLFRQLVQNLVSNAVKYSPAGEDVVVSVSPAGTSLAVIDHGPGIPPEEHEKLWSLYSRASAQPTAGESSTGVGLALAKCIAESLGCVIALDPDLGASGASFRLEFSGLVHAAKEPSVLIPRPPAAGVGGSKADEHTYR